MAHINFFHSFKHDNKHYLLVGTEDAIDRLLRLYRDEQYKLVTLWNVTDLTQLDVKQYDKIKIVN